MPAPAALEHLPLKRPPQPTPLAPATMPLDRHGAREAKPRSLLDIPHRVRITARSPTVGSPRPPLLRLLRPARRRLRVRIA